jgi:hypothetical protein
LAEAQHGTVVLQDGSDNTTRFVLSLPAVDWNDAVLDADQPT